MAVEIITTVTAPATPASAGAGAYDLTTLDIVKDDLRLTDADVLVDDWLRRAITQASDSIARYCNRVFQVEGLTDLIYIQQDPYPYQLPAGIFALQLSRWPLVGTIATVTQTIAGPGSGTSPTTVTLTNGVDFTQDSKKGWLVRLNKFTGIATAWEAVPVTVAYTAGFTKRSWREAQTVPSSGSYAVTVDEASAFALDQGVVYATSGASLTAVTSSPAQGQYSVSSAGVYTFNAADAGAAVLISYLYAAVPDEIVEACLRLVTGRYRARGRDPMLKQRDTTGLGTEVFWVGAPPMRGNMPEEIASILDNYRVPVTA